MFFFGYACIGAFCLLTLSNCDLFKTWSKSFFCYTTIVSFSPSYATAQLLPGYNPVHVRIDFKILMFIDFLQIPLLVSFRDTIVQFVLMFFFFFLALGPSFLFESCLCLSASAVCKLFIQKLFKGTK